MTGDAAIRSGAKNALENREYAELIAAGYEGIRRGFERAYAKFLADETNQYLDAENGFTDFLIEKLEDRAFLQKLLEAKSPEAYLATSAYLYAVDSLRKRAPGALSKLDAPPEEGGTPEFDEGPSEVVGEAAALLGELPVKDRVLLKVMYVERGGISAEEVQWLADKRGVAVERVWGELETRIQAISEARGAKAEEVEARHLRIVRLQQRHRQVLRIIRELDGDPAEPTDASGILASDEQAIRNAKPGARSALLSRIEEQIATQDRLRGEALEKAEDPLVGKKGYEEVARILGELQEGATAAEQKKAINTVTVRLKRIRKRLLERTVS